MFALTFTVYQTQTIWLMLIYNEMKAWFCEAYENIGDWDSMLFGRNDTNWTKAAKWNGQHFVRENVNIEWRDRSEKEEVKM